jgi:hypothetical protein
MKPETAAAAPTPATPAGWAGADLPSLLARLTPDEPPAPRPAAGAATPAKADFVERLSHWLGWTGAIELSAALGAPSRPAPAPTPTPAPAGPVPAGPLEAAWSRLQVRLQADIAAMPAEPLDGPPDFAPWRRHVLGLQQAIQREVDALRQRLRQALATAGTAGPERSRLAQLAALDAVLQRNLAPQQRALLGWVPLRLQAHYEHLQRQHPGEDALALARRFLPALQVVLQAELALQAMPVRGLLAASRAHAPASARGPMSRPPDVSPRAGHAPLS